MPELIETVNINNNIHNVNIQDNFADSLTDGTPIQRFFAGTSIFVTGGTGFLGKVLIEKLLRSCPHISTLYVLVRSKKGRTAQDRVEELFDDVLFERLKAERPKFGHKIVGVVGDCGLADLGLSMQDRQILIQEVSVVFHVAATVKFDEKLKQAMSINVKASKEVVALCKKMPNLKVAVHVSTAYSNCPQSRIEERFYPPPMNSNELITLVDTLNENLLDTITPKLLNEWPNTYAFTKAIAEDVVRQDSKGLPMVIVRPSIIISTYKEPIEGWISNLYGPTGVCGGVQSGVLRTMPAKSDVNANIIPVDFCVNAMIAAAWEVGENFAKKSKTDEGEQDSDNQPPIYHIESSDGNPITWGRFMETSVKWGLKVPTVKAIWYYCFSLQHTFIGFNVSAFLLHMLPASICDLALFCFGKTPRFLKIYRKIHHYLNVISYFSTRNWSFESNRIKKLWEKMSEKDRRIFYCNIRELDWDTYCKSYIEGIRVYLIKDPMSTIQEATVRWNKLFWLHQFTKLLLLYIVLRVFWTVYTIFSS